MSVVYHSNEDQRLLEYVSRKSAEQAKDKKKAKNSSIKLRRVVEYCTKLQCRRVTLLNYFDETVTTAKKAKTNRKKKKNKSRSRNSEHESRSISFLFVLEFNLHVLYPGDCCNLQENL